MKLNNLIGGTRSALAAIPMALALLAGTTAAMAQVATTATPTAVFPKKTMVPVSVSGTVPFGTDSIVFSKQAVEINSTLSQDADLTVPPQLIVEIAFLKVTGQAVNSKLKYVTDTVITKVRPVVGTQTIELTVPFTEMKFDKFGKAIAPATLTAAEETRLLTSGTAVGSATFILSVDTNGTLTGATGSIDASLF